MPEIRIDPVTGRWVMISTERANRPQQSGQSNGSTDIGPCPFCAGNEAMTPPEVLAFRGAGTRADMPGWTVRVVPNKYPALVNDGSWIEPAVGFYESKSAAGVHEVIIESPAHLADMATLGERQTEKVLRAYRERMLELSKDKRWRSILVYKNQGAQAGATLPHVHSQLVALPAAPKAILEEVDGAKKYFDSKGRCIYCDMIRQEADDGRRMVAAHERFVAFCPYAPRFPYETWLFPKEHGAFFEQGSDQEVAELARSLRDLLMRLNRALDNPPFNFIIHSNPLDDAGSSHYHWHIEILPKLIQVAGFEWGTGSFINTVAPEDAARRLRQALP